MGFAADLSDGGAGLCEVALEDGQGERPGPEATLNRCAAPIVQDRTWKAGSSRILEWPEKQFEANELIEANERRIYSGAGPAFAARAAIEDKAFVA
jgi:hypothetical protein